MSKSRDNNSDRAGEEIELLPEKTQKDLRNFIPVEDKSVTGAVYVPVTCRICQMRFYMREEHIGNWVLCPDCETELEITDCDSRWKYFEKNENFPELDPVPISRISADYRMVEGSVDFGKDPLPETDLTDDPTLLEKTADLLTGLLATDKILSSGQITDSVINANDPQDRLFRNSQEAAPPIVASDPLSKKYSSPGRSLKRYSPSADPRTKSSALQILRRIFLNRKRNVISAADSEQFQNSKNRQLNESKDQKDRLAKLIRSQILFFILTGTTALSLGFLVTRFVGALSTHPFLQYYSLNTKDLDFEFFFLLFLSGILIFPVWIALYYWTNTFILSGTNIFYQTLTGQRYFRLWNSFRLSDAQNGFRQFGLIGLAASLPGALLYFILSHSLFRDSYNSLMKTLFDLTGKAILYLIDSNDCFHQEDFSSVLPLFSFGTITLFSLIALFPVFWISAAVSSDRRSTSFIRSNVLKNIIQKPGCWILIVLTELVLFVILFLSLVSILVLALMMFLNFPLNQIGVPAVLVSVLIPFALFLIHVCWFRLLGRTACSILNQNR